MCFTNPKSWNRWLSLAQWWYNATYHSAIRRSHFEAMFGYRSTLLPAISESSPTMAKVGHYFQQRQQLLTVLKQELANARNQMKQIADRRRSDRTFEIGDLVYLKVRRFLQQPYTVVPPSKLSPKYFRPYPIVAKIGPVAYRLQLPEGVTNHLLFHVSLLKKATAATDSSQTELPPNAEEAEEIMEPRAILQKRIMYEGKVPLTQILVQWSHLHPDHTTWEYLPNLLKQFPRAMGLL